MMNQEALALIDLQKLIESRSLSFWQKYVSGINMTFINCEYLYKNCHIPRIHNQFNLYAHHKEVSYVEVDENVAYYSSLIVPIFKEIGALVNYSIHLYVNKFEGKSDTGSYLDNLIDGFDGVPMIYDDELRIGYSCAKPLFISNQISILSPVVKRDKPEVINIWKAFNIKVWIFISVAFLFIVLMNKIISMFDKHEEKKTSLFGHFWIYFKPLIGIGESFKHRNYVYLLWGLAVIPLTEIFKNELLVNLVAVPDVYADNIDDMLDEKWNIYTNAIDLEHWRAITKERILDDKELNDRFDRLFNKTIAIDITPEGQWFQLMDKPKSFIKKLKKSVLFEDDQSVKLFEMVLKKMVKPHFGTEAYVPKLITPLCYRPDFNFTLEAKKVTLRLFEVSLLNYWYEFKSNFYLTAGLMLLKQFKGDVFDQLIDEESELEPLKMIDIKSVFLWLLYCSAFHSIVFGLELLYSAFRNYQMFNANRTERRNLGAINYAKRLLQIVFESQLLQITKCRSPLSRQTVVVPISEPSESQPSPEVHPSSGPNPRSEVTPKSELNPNPQITSKSHPNPQAIPSSGPNLSSEVTPKSEFNPNFQIISESHPNPQVIQNSGPNPSTEVIQNLELPWNPQVIQISEPNLSLEVTPGLERNPSPQIISKPHPNRQVIQSSGPNPSSEVIPKSEQSPSPELIMKSDQTSNRRLMIQTERLNTGTGAGPQN